MIETTQTEPVTLVTAADLIDTPSAPVAAAPAPAPVEMAAASVEEPAAVDPSAPTDSAGVPFDASRHLAKPHKKTGRWMPKGGRKRKAAPSVATVSATPAPTLPPIPEIAPADDDDDDTASGPESTAATPAEAVPVRDARMSTRAAGELASRALYAGTGALTGDHKGATATGPEHDSIRDAFASYFEFRGIALVGLLALLGTVAAYLVEDRRRAAVVATLRRWFGSSDTPPPAVGPAKSASSPRKTPPPTATQAAMPQSPFASSGL